MGSETAEKIRKTLNQNAFASAIALVIVVAAILIYAAYSAIRDGDGPGDLPKVV